MNSEVIIFFYQYDCQDAKVLQIIDNLDCQGFQIVDQFCLFFCVETIIFLIKCKFKVLRFEFNILIISYNVGFF